MRFSHDNTWRILNVLVWFSIFLVGTAQAQQEEKTKLRWSLNGSLEQDHISYFRSAPHSELGRSQDDTKISLFFSVDNPDGSFHFKSSARAILNFQTEARTQLLLNEAFMRFRQKGWLLKIGKQIIDWGSSTGFSPADRLNRFNYFDFLDLDEEELGSWALHAHWTLGKSGLGLTFLPFYQFPALFPGDSRWSLLPVNGQYRVSQEAIPSSPIQFAFNWSLPIGNADLKLLYYHGMNAIPKTEISPLAFDPLSAPRFAIDFQHQPLQMASIAFSSYLGAFNFWGELNGIKTSRVNLLQERVDSPYFHFILGFDRLFTFSNRPESSLTTLLQYVRLFNFQGHEFSNLELDLIFQNALLSRNEFQINYKWTVNWLLALELKHGGYYHQLGVQFKPRPLIKLWLGSDLLGGREDGFFGHYSFNQRLQVKVNVLFSVVEEDD